MTRTPRERFAAGTAAVPARAATAKTARRWAVRDRGMVLGARAGGGRGSDFEAKTAEDMGPLAALGEAALEKGPICGGALGTVPTLGWLRTARVFPFSAREVQT